MTRSSFASPGLPRGNTTVTRSVARAPLRCTQDRSRTTRRVGAPPMFFMDPRRSVARALASAMLSASLSKPGLVNRGAAVIGHRSAWLRNLAKRILVRFGEGTRPAYVRLERFILNDRGFLRAHEKRSIRLLTQRQFAPKMCAAAGPPRTWQLPSICTTGELAQRLNLLPNELAWFADCRSLEEKLPAGPLRHYHYRWQGKRDGSARLIEGPK